MASGHWPSKESERLREKKQGRGGGMLNLLVVGLCHLGRFWASENQRRVDEVRLVLCLGWPIGWWADRD